MLKITICFLYLAAALAFGFSRLPRAAARERPLALGAFIFLAIALTLHGWLLYVELVRGGSLSIASAASLIGLQLGLIALLGALDVRVRGLAAGLLIIAAFTSIAGGQPPAPGDAAAMSWQLRAHVLTSMFAYGLLTTGSIVAVYALLQERRLRSARLSAANALFAPLETMEKLLYAVTTAGFTVLALSVVSGVTFIEDLFAQHLVHKTTLSLLALLVFGLLLLGRHFAGWRGKRAIYLYLLGFAFLCLAYFGSRWVLEGILGRSWS